MDEKVKRIINDLRARDGLVALTELNDNWLLREDLGFDSLALAALTVMIEDEFDVDIFEDGIIRSLSELMEKIRQGENKN